MSSRRYGSRSDRDRQGRLRRPLRRRPTAESEEADPALTRAEPLFAERYDEEQELAPVVTEEAERGGGVLGGVMRWLRGERRPTLAERGDPPPGEDPVRRILSIPRGPSRLDMFEETLTGLTPGTHGHRGVALAFHRELVSMAEQAAVDLSLLKRRVEACAEALILAGESERAGELLARIGKQHRAAELFVSAGAIDKLDEAHFEIEQREGGTRLEAHLAFERFEARFLVGLRHEAISALERAVALWPENVVYREVLDGVRVRLPPPGVIDLRVGARTVRVVRQWPLLIGRGEDAALRLKSPLISRTHAEIGLVDGRPFLRSVSDKGGVRVGGEEASSPIALEGAATLEVGGVPIASVVKAGWVELTPTHEPDRSSFGLFGEALFVAGAWLKAEADGRFHVQKTRSATLNGDRILKDTLLLKDDVLEATDASGQPTRVVVLGP